MKLQVKEHGKNLDILKDILHILLILIGLKTDKTFNPMMVHMKFYFGMQKVNKETQVEPQH